MAMQSTLRDIVAIAGFDNLPIVFEGPVGSGKTLLAELSHSLSRRSRGPFVSAYLNQCAPEMVAAELFGVTKGAATGVDRRKGLIASAEGGTLFIDELQALSLEHQEVIKNVIERRQYRPIGSDGPEIACNVRFILATNEPIDQLISNGRMRRDFARRIDVASIRVPALSERVEDIPGLANAAVDRWCADAGQQGARPKVPPETLNYLLSASFQDNVAGLLNKVTRACLRAGEALELRPEHFELFPDPGDSLISKFVPKDYIELTRLGPRDKSSQRIVFDLLVGAAPNTLSDDELAYHIKSNKAALQTVISRLNARFGQTPYTIRLDPAMKGYYLTKECSK